MSAGVKNCQLINGPLRSYIFRENLYLSLSSGSGNIQPGGKTDYMMFLFISSVRLCEHAELVKQNELHYIWLDFSIIINRECFLLECGYFIVHWDSDPLPRGHYLTKFYTAICIHKSREQSWQFWLQLCTISVVWIKFNCMKKAL